MVSLTSSMPISCREVDVHVSGRALQLAYSTLRHQLQLNECVSKTLTAFLVGSKPTCVNHERVLITLDRLDLGRSVATGSDNRPIKMPTVFSSGDWALPVEFSMDSHAVAITHTTHEYTAALQSLISHVSSRAPVDVGQLLVGRGTCAFHPAQVNADSDVAFAFCCNVVTLSTLFEVQATEMCKLSSTPLVRDLTSAASSWLWQEPQVGYVVRSRETDHYQLTLFFDQPALDTLQLCGLWVSGVPKVSHPFVWAACQRFIQSGRRLHTARCSGDYLLLLYSGPNTATHCYHWHMDSQAGQSSQTFTQLGCCHRESTIKEVYLLTRIKVIKNRHGSTSVTLHELAYGSAHVAFQSVCHGFALQSRPTATSGTASRATEQLPDYQPRHQAPQPHDKRPKIAKAAVPEVSIFMPSTSSAGPDQPACEAGSFGHALQASRKSRLVEVSSASLPVSQGIQPSTSIPTASSSHTTTSVQNERIEEWLSKQRDTFQHARRPAAPPLVAASSVDPAPWDFQQKERLGRASSLASSCQSSQNEHHRQTSVVAAPPWSVPATAQFDRDSQMESAAVNQDQYQHSTLTCPRPFPAAGLPSGTGVLPASSHLPASVHNALEPLTMDGVHDGMQPQRHCIPGHVPVITGNAGPCGAKTAAGSTHSQESKGQGTLSTGRSSIPSGTGVPMPEMTANPGNGLCQPNKASSNDGTQPSQAASHRSHLGPACHAYQPALFTVSPLINHTPRSRVQHAMAVGEHAADGLPNEADFISPESGASAGSLGTIKGPPASSVSQQVPAQRMYFRNEDELRHYEAEKLRMVRKSKENYNPDYNFADIRQPLFPDQHAVVLQRDDRQSVASLGGSEYSSRAQSHRPRGAPKQPLGHLAIHEPNMTVAPPVDMDLSMQVDVIAQRRLGSRAWPRHVINQSSNRDVHDYDHQSASARKESYFRGADHSVDDARSAMPSCPPASQGSILNVGNMTLGTHAYLKKYGLLDGESYGDDGDVAEL